MEGENEPTELTRLNRDLRETAADSLATGEWLASAMQASRDVATALLDIADLADVVGERHRIIANDWQAADMSALAGRLLVRATDVLDHVDFSPAALRADLAASGTAPRLLYSAGDSSRTRPICSVTQPALFTATSEGGAPSVPVSNNSPTTT